MICCQTFCKEKKFLLNINWYFHFMWFISSEKAQVLEITSTGKSSTCLSQTANTMATGALSMPGARASTTMVLTHCGLVIPCGNIDLGQHWLRVDLSSKVFCSIHLRVISIEMLMNLIHNIWRLHFENYCHISSSQWVNIVCWEQSGSQPF